jgi:hypothetical protein
MIYAYNPRTATLPVALYVLKRWAAEIAAVKEQKRLADEQVAAVLNLLTSTPSKTLELLAASASEQGYDGGRLESLQNLQRQFWGELPQDVRAAIPEPGGAA